MGSLPNLHELEQIERRREKRRERAMREQLAKEMKLKRERERKTNRKNYAYNNSGMDGDNNLNGGIQHNAVPTRGQIGGTSVTFGAQARHKYEHSMYTHHNRRSASLNKHRVMRTKSSGAAQLLWDEQMLKYLSAYSPVSTRSHRINPVSSYYVQAALASCRRRESINSSIGATSIRRLITLNSRNCLHKIPAHVRRNVYKSFTFITLAHGLMCAILIPMFGLQGSNSIWHHREQWLQMGPTIGSLLLSISMLLASVMSLMTPLLLRKVHYSTLISVNYLAVCIFLLCHLYPSIYTLLPAYMVLGMTYSPSWISKIALLVHYGSKLSCVQHDCMLMSMQQTVETGDEHKLFCNRDPKVRRLARCFQLAKDVGCVLGALLASWTIACTPSDWNCLDFQTAAAHKVQMPLLPNNYSSNNISPTWSSWPQTTSIVMAPLNEHLNYFKEYYLINEHGIRICGADMCPLQWSSDANNTIYTPFINEQTRVGASTLISIYLALSMVSLLSTVLVGKIRAIVRCKRFEPLTDTVLFAGPLAFFVGTEQAYILGDFLRAFVSCTLGISMVAGAIIGMGIMQAIVSCTLSMLLRHIKRIVVILAGFFFHSCLLLALSTWKPSSDDSALFYVLAAAWGACNGMWETLMLALVTLHHTNHVTEIAAPLQALRFLGLAATFAVHGFICETPKIITLVVLLVLSVPPYAMLEIRLETKRKAQIFNL